MPFSNLGFSPAVLPALQRALQGEGFDAPTEIQIQAIPAVLQGRDVLATAQTGSGKTAAFSLPILQQISLQAKASPRATHSLVIVPTRELAVQVGNAINSFAIFLPQRVKVAVVFGGVSVNPQMMHLRGGADIVVATPGRLLDLIDSNAVSIGHVRTLVLDEADKLLDMGFGDELGRILALLPAQRQNLFFSATFPAAMQALAQQILRDPLKIQVIAQPETAPDIIQRAIAVDAPRRTQLLRTLIETEKWPRVLVFAATKHATEIIAVKLRTAGISAEPFHGELSQGKRSQVLMDFKAHTLQVVVATDVAARGIDIAQLPVVVNYDLPRSAVDYTHRIGRTGRAGQSGLAVSLVSASTTAHWRLICKRQALAIVLEQVLGFESSEMPPEPSADPAAPSNGGIKGMRPSKKDKLRAAAALAASQAAR
jgi:ATP-dependent RNA helicase RhlE